MNIFTTCIACIIFPLLTWHHPKGSYHNCNSPSIDGRCFHECSISVEPNSRKTTVIQFKLLEQNGQFSDERKESCVHELVDYLFPNWHKQSGVNCNKIRMGESTFPSLVGRKHQEMPHKDLPNILKVSKEKALRQQKGHDAAEITEDQKCNFSTFAQHEMIAVPLTLEDVALFCPVVEAKPLGNYWTNYADKDSIISDEKY